MPVRWEIDTGFTRPVVVEVADPDAWHGFAMSFRVDGVPHKLGGNVYWRPTEARFAIGGRPASMALRLVRPRFGVSLRRAFGGAFHPLNLLGSIISGTPDSAGAAATMLLWAIYELTLDGQSQGIWILKSVGGAADWRLVKPGQWLPGRTSEDWPPELRTLSGTSGGAAGNTLADWTP